MLLKSFKNLYIFAKDISGAQQVLALAKRFPDKKKYFLLEGLGKKYIEEALGNVSLFQEDEVRKLDPKKDCILIGTSADPGQYLNSIIEAKSKGILTAAVLEHYCNYPERFNLNPQAFPDLIFTTDIYAYNIAKREFATSKVELIPDYFFLDQKKELDSLPTSHIKYPTYFTQNIQGIHFNDLDCIEFFLEKKSLCDELTGNNSNILVIRNHPTENPSKYKSLKSKYKDLEIRLDENKNFIETLKYSNYVVGLDTNPMFISLKLDLPVFCSSPDTAWKMSADLDKVTYLNRL